MANNDDTTQLQRLLDRYLDDSEAADGAAFNELIDYAGLRLRSLAKKMLARYPHVRRWEETDDVMQAALVRLHRSLGEVRPDNKRAFFGLAATQTRRTLIDLARHYYGTYGIGKNHHSAIGSNGNSRDDRGGPIARSPDKPQDLEQWTAFHEAIDRLPAEEQEVISLVWYGGLLQKEVAKVLDVSERTVIRRMNRARLALNDLLGAQPPSDG